MNISKFNCSKVRDLPKIAPRWLALGFLSIYFASLSFISADVRSLNGTIDFHANHDGIADMTLNSTGLGIGVLPSTNLQVAGNAIVTQQLFIGGSAGASNLNINGSFGMTLQTVSENTLLAGNTCVLADASTSNIVLTLPHAGNVLGRMYAIKKISLNNIVQINAGNNLLDSYSYYSLASGNLGSIKVISNGSSWSVIEKYNGADEAWTPQKISTALWLDASDATNVLHVGGNVHQWSDKSGQGNHATQSNATYKPKTNVRTLYGKNVLDFTSQQMATNLNIDRTAAANLSVFVVFAQDSTIGTFGLFGADNGIWDRFAILNFDASFGLRWSVSNGVGVTPFEPTQTPNTSNHILSIVWAKDVASGSLVSLDGATPTVFTENAANSGFTTTGIGAIQPVASQGYPMDGYIAEIIFMTSLADTLTRQKIEAYLAHKWGLNSSFPSGHPYKIIGP